MDKTTIENIRMKADVEAKLPQYMVTAGGVHKIFYPSTGKIKILTKNDPEYKPLAGVERTLTLAEVMAK